MKKIVRQCVLLRRQFLLFDDRHIDLEFMMLSGNIICSFVDVCWVDYFIDGATYEIEFAYRPRLMFSHPFSKRKYYRSELKFFPLARVGVRHVN